MARSVRRGFATSFTVWEDGVQVGEVFKGPGAKERAEQFALNPPVPTQSKLSALEGDRAHWAKVNADLAKPVNEVLAAMRGVLEGAKNGAGAPLFQDRHIRMMLQGIEPIIKSGGQSFRRARRQNVLPAQASV